MQRPIETHEVGQLTVKIYPDDSGDHDCPIADLSKDDGIIFACFDPKSSLQTYNPFSGGKEAIDHAKDNDYEWFYLYKYDHSGVAYSARSFIGRAHHAEWDSGSVGLILIKRTTEWNDTAKRYDVAESWCKALTTWANGWYYGYVIEDPNTTHVDSCWGFDDMAYCVEEAKMSAHYHVNKTGVK